MLRIKIRQGHGGLQFYIEKVGSPNTLKEVRE